MKLRGLLIACLILAVLLGGLYWSNRHSSPTDTAKVSPDAPPQILALSQPDITALAILRRDGPPLNLSRNTSGAWQITSPNSLGADQDAVSGLLSTLSPLNSERLLDDKASNLAPYGLAAPSLEVDIVLKSGKTQKILIGNQTPSGSAFYAMLAGDPRLFTIASFNKTALDKTADDLRDKRLLTADFDKVSQIELITQQPGKKQDITFARNKDAWQILKPEPYRAETSQVDDLIRSLKDAKMEKGSGADNTRNAAAFQSAALFATVKITGASGTQDLEIRKLKDDCYAKSTAIPGVYKVPATVGASLDKSLDTYRNKKLFDFGYDDPSKIEIHDGAKSYFLTRHGSDWWGQDGKKLDDTTAEMVLGKIRDLAATKFAESGFAAPTLELAVTSNGGNRVEKVSIAKHGDEYIAKRDNEPALYEIPASEVQQLQQSAENLKPAAAPKK